MRRKACHRTATFSKHFPELGSLVTGQSSTAGFCAIRVSRCGHLCGGKGLCTLRQGTLYDQGRRVPHKPPRPNWRPNAAEKTSRGAVRARSLALQAFLSSAIWSKTIFPAAALGLSRRRSKASSIRIRANQLRKAPSRSSGVGLQEAASQHPRTACFAASRSPRMCPAM